MERDIKNLRQNYVKGQLTEDIVLDDPIDQFRLWFEEARTQNIYEPNAMTLSTIDLHGHPSSRVVLLKEIDDDGFLFYTNYTSDKGQEIENHSFVALNFLWLGLERQVRIAGRVKKVSRERSQAYFHGRPRGSQIGAWVSDQSSIIDGREALEERLKEVQEQYKNDEIVPVPPHWGGYKVIPGYVEFWQGRPSRLHDRLRYQQKGEQWKIVRLSP